MKMLKFGAPWCAQCRVLETLLKNENIEHESINVENNEELTEQYKIRNLPTCVILDKNGEEVGRFTGIRPVALIKKELDMYSANEKEI